MGPPPVVHGLVRFFEKEELTFFPDVVIHGLDSINDIPLLCAQKHAVFIIGLSLMLKVYRATCEMPISRLYGNFQTTLNILKP